MKPNTVVTVTTKKRIYVNKLSGEASTSDVDKLSGNYYAISLSSFPNVMMSFGIYPSLLVISLLSL